MRRWVLGGSGEARRRRAQGGARPLAAAMLALLFPLAAPATPLLFLDIAGQGASATVGVGGPFAVVARASSIPSGADGRGLFGFGFSVSYAALGLSLGTPVAGLLWIGPTVSSASAGLAGITSVLFGSPSGPSGNGIALATITLTALQPGTYTLAVSHYVGVGDNVLFDGTVLDGAGSGYFQSASVVVVPEVRSAVGILVGIVLLGLLRRERVPVG